MKVEKCIVVFRLLYVTFFLLFSRFDSKWLSGSFRILHRASLLKQPFTFMVGQVFFYGRFQLLLVVMGMLSFPMMPVLFFSGSIYIIFVVTQRYAEAIS